MQVETASDYLAGFSEPVSFTKEAAGQAPQGPGVHVLWGLDPPDEVLYVGETKQLSQRLHAHLSGSGSVLAEQVAAMLKSPEGDPSPDELRAWFAQRRVSWLESSQRHELKRNLVLALRPRFNRQIPGPAKELPEEVAAADELVARLFKLRQATTGDGPAPHKPLLVLLALERIRRGRGRLATYADWATPLAVLLRRWSTSAGSPATHEPIWRLQRDGVWEVLAEGQPLTPAGGGEPSIAELSADLIRAGLTSPLHHKLRLDLELLAATTEAVAGHYFGEQAIAVVESVKNSLDGATRLWWVNQGASYRQQRDGWHVWAPLTTQGGHAARHHTNVSLLRPGDVIIHYSDGSIRAVGDVLAEPEERDRPSALPTGLWGDAGHYCLVEYFPLAEPVPLQDIPDRDGGAGPFDVNGNVKQAYLLEVTDSQAKSLDTFRGRWPAHSPLGPDDRQYWLFVAGRETSVSGTASTPGSVVEFTLSRFRGEVRPGDGVVVWQAGDTPGAIAVGEVVDAPSPVAPPVGSEGDDESGTTVRFRYKRVFSNAVSAATCTQNEVLSTLQVLRGPNDPTFALDRAEWRELIRLSDMESAKVADPNATLADICQAVGKALLEANLDFGPRHGHLVRTAVTSLATKRFLILTGLSGSGKSRLGIALGEWFGPENLKLVAVRPDWTGPDALLGYENGLTEVGPDGHHAWTVPAALEFILKASRNPTEPHLLLLDEMNLAHVERYFADVLSGMESRKAFLPNVQRQEGEWRNVGEPLEFPDNLFIVGTVNVDETTYIFSPKVLDRANTIEFRVTTGDLLTDPRPIGTVPAGSAALTRRLLDISTQEHPGVDPVLTAGLRDLHALLAGHDREFGHRVFYEALRFAVLWQQSGTAGGLEPLDVQVLQKILPRFHGSIRQIGAALRDVTAWCYLGPGTERPSDFDPDAVTGAAVLPLSFDKCRRMWRRLQRNHFVGFAE